jgi:hypothetical protein
VFSCTYLVKSEITHFLYLSREERDLHRHFFLRPQFVPSRKIAFLYYKYQSNRIFISLHVNCLLLLLYFNQNWLCWYILVKFRNKKSSRTSVWYCSHFSMRKDRHTNMSMLVITIQSAN